MLTLHVEASTIRALIDKVADEIGLMVTMPVDAPKSEPASGPSTPEIPPVVAPPTTDIKRKPGRPPKAAPVNSAPASTVAVVPASPPDGPAELTTKEQVKAAFHKLAERRADETNEVGGLNRVYAIVNQFTRADGESCRKLGEIQPHDYPAVLAATEQAISAGVSA